MRAVFVNHCHPDTPHVCALRLKSFAAALARQGHRIVLLTETLNPEDAGADPANLEAALDAHDWSHPFILNCKPVDMPGLVKLREGRVAYGIRHVRILANYLGDGGMFTDWRRGAGAFHGGLAEHFRPDVIWATFGNTDAWNIAQDLARAAKCPWVADIKDNWRTFMPHGLRQLIANRYKDAAHMTTFSEGQSLEAADWFAQEKTVVYSGFAALENGAPAQGSVGEINFRVVITGSLYGATAVDGLLTGIGEWTADAGRAVEVIYAGSDADRFRQAAGYLRGAVNATVHDFLPLAELQVLQRSASVNVYARKVGSSNVFHFHHKVFELLAAGQPVLCYPGETPEARRLAEACGGGLLSCNAPGQIPDALNSVAAGDVAAADLAKLQAYTWDEQAKTLASVLESVGGSP